jgi:arabinofuranosyltransferase
MAVQAGSETATAEYSRDAGGRKPRQWSRRVPALVAAVITLVLGYQHRWVGDDAVIYTRTVRQILAGNGPVFNTGERVETSTGTLWQWLLALLTWVTDANPARLALIAGLCLSVAGVWIAVEATGRMYFPLGSGTMLVPAGVLALLPVKFFSDYTTSGLETGLVFAWLAAAWWTMVALRLPCSGMRLVAGAVVLGLGPMVRPDLAICSAVFGVTLWWLQRPRIVWTLTAVVTGGLLPLGYEVFRAGYYGVLVPEPALAKDAGSSAWASGWAYLQNGFDPYLLWLPLVLVLGLLLVVVLADIRGAGRMTPLAALTSAAVAAGALSLLYVVRVGGDFMHGRMLLPGLFLLLLPAMVVPFTRGRLAVGVAIAAWAVVCGCFLRPPLSSGEPFLVMDEQSNYHEHLSAVERGALGEGAPPRRIAAGVALMHRSLRDDRPVLVYYSGPAVPLNPKLGVPVALVDGTLGENGGWTPLDGYSVDRFSLASPIGAHQERSTLVANDRAGHQKELSRAWIVAAYADPRRPLPDSRLTRGVSPADVAAARHALTCGGLAELHDAVSRPLTAQRFWDNLIGAPARTAFRYPASPRAAEHALCPSNEAQGPGDSAAAVH